MKFFKNYLKNLLGSFFCLNKLFFLSAFLLLSLYAKTQDRIITGDSTVLEVNIIEITDKNVRYISQDADSSTINSIKLAYVVHISYHNGTEQTYGYANPRIERNYGLSIGYLFNFDYENHWLITNIDFFITPSIELGLNVGALLVADGYGLLSIGGKYHFRNRMSTSPFSLFAGLSVVSTKTLLALHMPLGVQYLFQNGFKYSLSVVPITNFLKIDSYIELRIGYNFRK